MERYQSLYKEQENSHIIADYHRLEKDAKAAFGPRWYDELQKIISCKASGMRSADELRKADLAELKRLRDMAQDAMYELKQFVGQAYEHIQAATDENERLERELDAAIEWASPMNGVPAPCTDVLAIQHNGRMCVAFVDSDDNWWTNEGTALIEEPLHWIPLPVQP